MLINKPENVARYQKALMSSPFMLNFLQTVHLTIYSTTFLRLSIFAKSGFEGFAEIICCLNHVHAT